MSITLRPTNKSDLKKSFGEVRNLIGMGTNESTFSSNVESSSIFGDTIHEGEEDKRYDDPYMRMGHIKLAIPVLNPFLAGAEGDVWQKVLGREIESSVADVVKGNKFYNIKEGKGVHVSQLKGAYSEKDWLVGGQYLRFLISKLDVEEEISNLIYDRFVYPVLSPKADEGEFTEKQKWRMFKEKVGSVTKGSGKCWLVDNYYFTANRDTFDYGRLSESCGKVAEETFNVHMDRLVLLLALRDNIGMFADQVQDYVFVWPKGNRPRIEGGPDPMSKQYNMLVKANNDLREVIAYSNIDIKTVQSRYKEVYNRVVNIMIGSDQIHNSDSYKPLMHTLAHKNGLIRGNMQSTRIDYSGRTVIVSDPTMPLDCIGLPKSVVAKLLEMDIIETWSTDKENKAFVMSKKNANRRLDKAIKMIEGEYVVIGRQPTLHYLGLQGMKVIVVEGNAIVLSPLVVTPYNADFDGDQMHFNKPQTEEAKEEVRRLMASTNNLFYPKNGEVTVVPRHEILYGLYVASSVKSGRSESVAWDRSSIPTIQTALGMNVIPMSLPEAIFEGVCRQVVNVYDTVNYPYNGCTCGKLAIKYALGQAYYSVSIGDTFLSGIRGTSDGKDGVASTSWCKAILQYIAENESKDYFVNTVNKLVKLGFAIAEIYPPTITLINSPNCEHLIEEFNQKIKSREELYNMGFETHESFTTYYSSEYSKLEKRAKEYLVDALGEDCGWLKMVESGAKGSMSNILQLFGFKGRITKSQTEAFNVCIEGSYNKGMTGLEHCLTSYGSRQGIIDKVVATDKPGYLAYKIKHTCSPIFITTDDCGTEEGLLLTYDDIKQFIPQYQLTDDEVFNNSSVKSYGCKLLVGRYIQPGSLYIDNTKQAEQFYDEYVASVKDSVLIKKKGLVMRSPITCANPCCSKCYGRELGTMAKHPAVGSPLGFVAAQAIGEPGTQLTMNNFHKGGVAGVGGLTTSFDKINDYLHLYSLRGNTTEEPLNYDFISPVEGTVEEVYLGMGTKEVKIMAKGTDGYKNRLRTKVIVYDDVELKTYVKQGESIQKVQGDLDVNEIKRERSIEEAQKYLALQLYDTFNREVNVSLKHFEMVVAGMTYYVCLDGDGVNYKTGCFYTRNDLYNTPPKGDVPFIMTLKGIGDVPKFKNDFFAAMFMEDIGTSVRRSMIMNPVDTMTDPVVRLSFGLNYGIGSDMGNYINER